MPLVPRLLIIGTLTQFRAIDLEVNVSNNSTIAEVRITDAALKEHRALPLVIQQRVVTVFTRLQDWPTVSGAKPLRGQMQGNFRIRTGDYRVIFRISPDQQIVTVWKIGYRRDVYD